MLERDGGTGREGKRMKKAICVLLLAMGTALGQVSAPPPAAPDDSMSAVSALHTRELLWQKMAAEVTMTERKFGGVMGVVIRDLNDGRELRINGDDVFPAASSIKVPLLLELYRQSQSGHGANLADLYTVRKEDVVESSDILENLTPGVTRVTNRDLAGFVVAVSDNAAANILIDRVGQENVNHMLQSLGLKRTRLRRKMMDRQAALEGRENVSTPSEEAALLELIYREKVLNPALTQEFLRLLSTEKASDLPRLLPQDLKIANKPGSLAGVRNDSGIVLLKHHPFVISVMTTYSGDGVAAEDAISAVALQAYRYFQSVENASDLGRDMTP
jgi:beta-lactamase class A